jgi:hypothetical protein
MQRMVCSGHTCWRTITAALESTAGVGVLILISSLDDLFIDVWYWVRQTGARC